jgi:integrase
MKGEGHLYKRGRVWWYKAPDGKFHSTKTAVQSEAVDFKARHLAQINADQPHIKSKSKAVTVSELLDAHLEYMRRKGRRSLKDVTQIVEKWLRPYFGKRIASTLKTSDFEKYRSERTPELEQATINRHMAYLRSGYHTGLKRMTPPLVDFVIPYFPMESEADNVRQGFIEYDGYVKIRAALTASLKPLFICGYHVSTRRREIKDLLWTQVDLKDNLIVLEKRNTKNKEGRVLPIYGDMLEALREQKKLRDAEFPDCPYVFFWHSCDRAISHGGTRRVPDCVFRRRRSRFRDDGDQDSGATESTIGAKRRWLVT